MNGTFQRLESSRPWKLPRSGKTGFTLLELLAVMAIIAVLVGIATRGYGLVRRQAKEGQAVAELEKIRTALEEFRVVQGRYPEQTAPGPVPRFDELARLVEGLRSVDPWGNDYSYVCTNRFFYALWSAGQDPDFDGDDVNPAQTGY